MKKSQLAFGIIFALVLLVAGGIYLSKKSEEQYMLDVINSEEANIVYHRTIKNIDNQAFTKEGIIQKYNIDMNSIEKNPLGGINLKLVINDDNDLIIYVILDKGVDGQLENQSGSQSAKLVELLEKENN